MRYESVEDRWPERREWEEREGVVRLRDGRRVLRIGRGDTLNFLSQVVLRSPANLLAPAGPQNISGWSFYFTAKFETPDPDAAAVCQITTTPSSIPAGGAITTVAPLQGFVAVSMPSTATLGFPDSDVNLEWDLRGIDTFNNTNTVDRGLIVVEPRATSFAPVMPTPLPGLMPRPGSTVAVINAQNTPYGAKATDVLFECDVSGGPVQVNLSPFPNVNAPLTVVAIAGNPATAPATVTASFPLADPNSPGSFLKSVQLPRQPLPSSATWVFDGTQYVLTG